MTELRPLLESSDDDFELALLQSVRADLPASSGLHDTALALGLTATTAKALAASLPVTGALNSAVSVSGASTVAPVGTSGGALVSGASSGVSALGVASLGALGKSLVGGALLSFVALTAIDQTREVSSKHPPAAQVPNAPAAVSRPPDADPPLAVELPFATPSEPRPEATPAPGLPVSNRHATSVASSASTDAPPTLAAPARAAFAAEPSQPPSLRVTMNASLAAETRILDQARAALAAGDTNRASDLLDAYAASRPSAILSQEAALLRVRVLLNRGQRPAAAALARRIIAQHPGSAHVDSLRRLADEP